MFIADKSYCYNCMGCCEKKNRNLYDADLRVILVCIKNNSEITEIF